MKNMVMVEYIKVRNNKFYLIAFLVVLMTSAIFVFSSPKTNTKEFIKQQHQQAEIMLNAIESNSNQEQESIKTLKNLYNEILSKNDWKSIYKQLNAIDEVSITQKGLVPTHQKDLAYDNMTNIKIREYYINQDINPFANAGGIVMKNVSYYIIDFLLVSITLLIGLSTILLEYENKTIGYLFSMPCSYTKIYFSKWLASILASIVTVIIPIIIVFLISCGLYGVTDSHVIFPVNLQFGNVIINDLPFLTIYKCFGYIMLWSLAIIIIVTNLVLSLSLCIKNKSIAIGISVALVSMLTFYQPLLLANRILSMNMPVLVLGCLIIAFLVLSSILAIWQLGKRDII